MKRSIMSIWVLILISSNFLFSGELPRIVILETMTLSSIQQRTDALILHLANEGYIDGKTVTIERYNAEKDRGRAKALLKIALKKGNPDLVLTAATLASQETYAALKGTGIPQIFYFVTDPVKAGLVKEMDVATGENITGFVHVLKNEELLELTLKVLSSSKNTGPYNIGFLYSSYPSSKVDYLNMKAVDEKRTDITIIPIFIEQLEMSAGLKRMVKCADTELKDNKTRYDYIWLGRGPLTLSESFLKEFIKLVDEPIIFGSDMLSVKNGALLTIMTSPEKDGQVAGDIVIEILQGVPVGEIPVTRTKHFQAGINMSTAENMGVTVPQDILDLAGSNIVK